MILWKWLRFKFTSYMAQIAPGPTSIGKKTILSFAPFTFKWFRFSLIVPLLTKEKKKKKEKKENRMKTHCSMSRVREKAGLLRLLSGLEVFFFWSIEANKHRCWRQNKRCDFRTFFRFSDFILRLAKTSQTKIFIVALGEGKKSVTGLKLLAQTFPWYSFFSWQLPTSRALTFVADLFLSMSTRRRSGGGPFTNLGYCSLVEKLINFINDTCI